ncbi:MAG: hypothetical protein H6621_01765 [Halobacteriovoraceae bacterium]|nr:hypothetical protein [Halobacteriovoraceae bacterium]MCB9093769.1 hypothetical protein [Halobacteriovoraceae bacterium]
MNVRSTMTVEEFTMIMTVARKMGVNGVNLFLSQNKIPDNKLDRKEKEFLLSDFEVSGLKLPWFLEKACELF